jgi:ribosome biogenesis protein MAK21
MGKKRTHAETRDGFTKPSPDKNRIAKHDRKDKDKDRRKNGDLKQKAALVCRKMRDAKWTGVVDGG